MKLQFTKMHALGNEFVVIDDRDAKLRKLSQLSKKLCDRRFGIGADQLLLLCHSKESDFRMRIFNADGSEVEMCGNGIRCLGKYIWDTILRCEESVFASRYCQTIDRITVETTAGIMTLHKTGNLFQVKMGEPIFQPEQIPVNLSCLPKRLKNTTILQHTIKVKNKTFKINCVSIGNPHTIITVKDVQSVPLEQYGPLIENHNLFPNRTNVEFIQIMNQSNIKMRVWERGAGETMACGTGASASAVASVLLGLTGRKVTVHLPGGKLLIHWSAKDNNVYMTGPAVRVFEGTIAI
jgi:diaminopimelate epimerase